MATTQQHSNHFSTTLASRWQVLHHISLKSAVLFLCAMFIYCFICDYSFVVDGERKREAEIESDLGQLSCWLSLPLPTLFSLTVSLPLYFCSLHTPLWHCQGSHGARLLSLSHTCQDFLTHFSRDHTPGSSGAKGWGQRSRSCLH